MRFVGKKKNLDDELINIPTKAEERSMIQSSFKTQDPTSIHAKPGIRAKIHTADPRSSVFSKSANPQSVDPGENPYSFPSEKEALAIIWVVTQPIQTI